MALRHPASGTPLGLEGSICGRKVLVLGAGASGRSAARFLRERGAVVGIFDDVIPLVGRGGTEGDGVGSTPDAIFVNDIDFENFDFCVISPGVSINHPIAQKFEGRIISELALGFTAPHKKIITITGTNGKTTVTNMIGKALGKKGVVCGNVGVPVTSVPVLLRKRTAVTEVSSFMLETPIAHAHAQLKPDIAVILNISQDHLERHGTMEEYIRCKAKLTNARKVILNYDCHNSRMLNDGSALFYSTSDKVRGVYLDGKDVVLLLRKSKKVIFNLDEFNEDRPHQISNILAVILACKLLKVSRKRILTACMGGEVREHRLQTVGEVGNVVFVNDSKATNIASALASCACFQSPINLLVGGVTKGQDFTELFTKLPKSVDHVFIFGVGADEIFAFAQTQNFKNITRCVSMKEATLVAFRHGFGPRVVLLAPACSSFDEFKNYKERGEVFVEVVKEIANAES